MKKKRSLLKKVYSYLHDDQGIAMGSLVVLTAVDLVGITIFLISISVDALTMVQFVALGVVSVLFKVRARIKRQNVAWFFWALISFFGGLMFTLNTVVIQGDDQKPAYVQRAESAYTSATDVLDDLMDQQSIMRAENRRSAAIEMEPSIEAARSTVDIRMKEAEDAEHRWRQEPKKEIRAIDIFARIPYVLKNPSAALLIAAAFFVILYMSIEASIFAIAGEIGRTEKKQAPVRRRRVEAERFADVTEDEYRASAEVGDGVVRLPEDVAVALGITRTEADKMHARLYAGFVPRGDRYVRIGGERG